MSKKFYVTTPIYYVTAKPHLGSLYSTLLADVLKRWHMLLGKKTYFLTGTDEHGQKIVQAAEKAGKQPKEFVDQFIPAYKSAWQMYEIAYDQFVRTTDVNHIKSAQQFIKKLIASDDIYKDSYQGWYCTPCETFVTEKEDADKKDGAPACPSCARETQMVSEETYFFRLSKYQDKLLAFYKNNPDFITPKERAHEVISFIESGLKDLSISRTTVKWGVPFPDDPEHTVYVWVEALCNYITAIGYGQPDKQEMFEAWWPADIQIVGKDIVRFHGIFWPAFLMAADLPLPKRLLVHGWIKIDKQKMSKSLGNVVDPLVLQERYGVEPVRYYLTRQMPINQDGDFSIPDLEQRITADLANDLGNLLNRMHGLAEKNNVVDIPAPKIWSAQAVDLRDEGFNVIEDMQIYMNDCLFHLALARLWKFINKVNAYFHEQEPWKVAKKDKDAFIEILSATCHSLRIIAVLLWPVMPSKMMELLNSLGAKFEPTNNTIEGLELGNWRQHFMLKKIPALFVKPEPLKEEMEPKESPEEKQEQTYITIDDFIKVELVTGTIEACEPVPNSDRLLSMQVDLGPIGKRQILAGVQKHYQPDELVGKQGVFASNLKPRKMAGLESQGMMLMAEDENKVPRMTTIAQRVPNGTRLK